MRITILDGLTANPGDLSWEGLERLGEVVCYDFTAADQLLERCGDSEIVITNKCVFGAEQFAALPKLRYIGLLATGYNCIDLEAAARHGVTVTNVPGYSTQAVAQTVFALLLEMTNHVSVYNKLVGRGLWRQAQSTAHEVALINELYGMTMGIFGYGSIGEAVGRIALAFGMKVLVCTRRTLSDLPDGMTQVDFDTLLSQSDVLSLHCPLTEETTGIIDSAAIAKMKPTAMLINTSRGPVLNAADVAAALNEGRLACAGLDVLTVEPPDNNDPLLHAKNRFITPHVAWAAKQARRRLLDEVTLNLEAFLRGEKRNSLV